MHLNHALRRYLKLKAQLAQLERQIKAQAKEETGATVPPRIETLLQRIQS